MSENVSEKRDSEERNTVVVRADGRPLLHALEDARRRSCRVIRTDIIVVVVVVVVVVALPSNRQGSST